ncbi:putative Ig domain-containing protein [[Leptolyngbya] sp. PCC 7376]|uniref:putative Ig domain-containing protein n=1 Tax=[Leptolyngbya] sp. PCC 7376 TaxID=111781 RepID=UPI00059FFE33|nr:putative Ig domain-containing protein [[Leptolyngbya] sp. PCC 7376]
MIFDAGLHIAAIAPHSTRNCYSIIYTDQNTAQFTVSWGGSDLGSSIATYDIYVSEDNSGFELWLDDTTNTSSSYTGDFDKTYSFFSVATDNVGNTEELPLSSDVSTIIMLNNDPILLNTIPDQILEIEEFFNFTFFSKTFKDEDDDNLIYTATLADGPALPTWLDFDPSTQTFSGTPTSDETITVKVTADDNKGDTISDEFNFTIIDGSLNGSENWISVPSTFQYSISFENEAVSTTSTQEVTITQNLDLDFDWDSFELDSFGWGDFTFDVPNGEEISFNDQINFTTDYGFLLDISGDFNPATGEAIWNFKTIDPATGELPANPNLAFLMPNNAQNGGKGVVKYTVSTDSNLQTGDILYSQANVIFDGDDLVETPEIFSIVDIDAPSSGVNTLPTMTTSGNFEVSWSGTDSGSGIASYDIYVSENGSSFNLWLDDTTDIAATYNGEDGNTYSFYSVAKDNVGNEESTPLGADTTTTVEFDPLTGMTTEVYRFYRKDAGSHLYTSDPNEIAVFRANPGIFTEEAGVATNGAIFLAGNAPSDGLKAVRRFYNKQTNGHFFTSDTNEIAAVQANQVAAGVFRDEGIAFYALEDSIPSLATDVYRFSNINTGAHFFTNSIIERDSVIANQVAAGFFRFEGVGWEAIA